MAEKKTNIALAESEEKKSENSKDKKTDPKPEEKKEETKAAAETEAEEKKEADEGEVDTDNLFKRRPSIMLTAENAKFTSSKGGMISLTVQGENGEEFFERVIVLRSFPVTAPNEFLSVREPDTRKKGRGAEIGMIRHLNEFDEVTKLLMNVELDLL